MQQLTQLSSEIDSLMADIEAKTGVSSSGDPFAMSELDALIAGLSTSGGPASPSPAKPEPTPQAVPQKPQIVPVMGVPARGSVVPVIGVPPTNGGVGSASPSPAMPAISSGPGETYVKPQAAGRGGGGIGGVATHTPDGKAIKVNAPPCDYCGEPIIGRVTNALGKMFHPEHFVCANCSQPFRDGKFVEHEGKPYCSDHYFELFAPRCFRCEQPIKEKIVKALGHSWHPNHFTCTGCGDELTGKEYREAGGDPYCPECKKNLEVYVDPKIHICARCKKPIIGWYITLEGQRMHPEHYRCAACGKEFSHGDCHEHNGKLYCKEDYDKLQKANCAGCRKPIIGRSITAMGRLWHPEHFCCTHCHTPFAGSQFYEKDGLPYCGLHYEQLFGRPCGKCGKPVTHNGVESLGKIWHKEHFTCQTCDEVLIVGGKICAWENKPLCKKCYLKLPGDIRRQIQKKQFEEDKMEKKRKKEEMKASKKAQKENKDAARKMKKEMKKNDEM